MNIQNLSEILSFILLDITCYIKLLTAVIISKYNFSKVKWVAS